MQYYPALVLDDFGKFPVDLGNLLNPLAAFVVLHLQDIVARPVEIVGDVSYLLLHLLKGVAYYSPELPKSASN